MNLLIIDDDPSDKKDNFKEVLETIPSFTEVVYLTNNTAEEIKPHLSRAGFIILDWMFPNGKPSGEETLALIREMGYKGPILIYSKMFGDFAPHLGSPRSGKAQAYHWLTDGTNTLINIILQVMVDKEVRLIEAASLEAFPYYENFPSMARFFYYPSFSMKGPLKDENELASQKVVLASTEWEFDGSFNIKPKGPMGKVILDIERVAPTDVSVLILGDTGTGKELVAKLLHYHHQNTRNKYEFLGLNCAAFHPNTLNVELFGSLPGAFTGGLEKAGIFEQVTQDPKASPGGGTVFLDEIGELLPSAQSSLLRVLQENYVLRMGHDLRKVKGTGDYINPLTKEPINRHLFGKIPLNFRLISATNAKLYEMVKKRTFRSDLIYRIQTKVIHLPSLKSRDRQDFNLLFQFFHERANKKHKRAVPLDHNNGRLGQVSDEFVKILWSHFQWWGNVRELEQLVEGMIASSDPTRKTPLDFNDIPAAHFKLQEILAEVGSDFQSDLETKQGGRNHTLQY
uniref:Sigma-54-dependent Fis family transcriptional regulator n=1 Tax=Desulfobacca acetoxidans TaxID=60893 RepID=A0A7V4LCB6_9BACT